MTIAPFNGGDAVTMSSREIAELTEKRHDNVLADIRAMLSELKKDVLSFQGIYLDSMNRQQVEYHLDRELTETLITGYSTTLRNKVIRRLHELEALQATPSLDTDEGKLLMIQGLATKQLALIAENKQIAQQRDHAIETKAEIGSRREATAMATASAAVREARQLKERLGMGITQATIVAVEKALGREFGRSGWHPLKKWCEARAIKAPHVTHPTFGSVIAWPAGAWLHAYQIDLTDLFGADGEQA